MKTTPELLMMRGLISALTAEDQAQVAILAQAFRDAVKSAGPAGKIALALVGVEMQAED